METVIRVIAVSLMVAALPASAQNLDEARSRFKRGTELYDEGNYRGALVEFERAFEASPNFRLLYNIGQVHLQLQDYARAVKSFTRYLSEGGADVPAARRDEVSKEIARLEPRIGQLNIETAKGAEVLIDDESVGFAPLPGPVPANTGRHKVSVVVNGQEMSRIVDVAGQQKLSVVLGQTDTRPAAPAAAVATEAPASGVRATMVVGWVATGALAISAAIFAGLAVSSSSELGQLRDSFGTTRAQLDAAAGRTRTWSLVADVLTGAAVVAGVVSLIITLTGPSRPAQVALKVGTSGLAVSGSF